MPYGIHSVSASHVPTLQCPCRSMSPASPGSWTHPSGASIQVLRGLAWPASLPWWGVPAWYHSAAPSASVLMRMVWPEPFPLLGSSSAVNSPCPPQSLHLLLDTGFLALYLHCPCSLFSLKPSSTAPFPPAWSVWVNWSWKYFIPVSLLFGIMTPAMIWTHFNEVFWNLQLEPSWYLTSGVRKRFLKRGHHLN